MCAHKRVLIHLFILQFNLTMSSLLILNDKWHSTHNSTTSHSKQCTGTQTHAKTNDSRRKQRIPHNGTGTRENTHTHIIQARTTHSYRKRRRNENESNICIVAFSNSKTNFRVMVICRENTNIECVTRKGGWQILVTPVEIMCQMECQHWLDLFTFWFLRFVRADAIRFELSLFPRFLCLSKCNGMRMSQKHSFQIAILSHHMVKVCEHVLYEYVRYIYSLNLISSS